MLCWFLLYNNVKQSSVQFGLVTQLCLFVTTWIASCQASLSPIHELAQTHVHRVSDDIQPSQLLSSLSPPAFDLSSSGYFPMSQLFASGGQSTGASAWASVLPMNIRDWFSLRWTGWIFLQSEGVSWVFSNTTVKMHQFFGTQLSLWSNSHIHTWLLEKP